MSEGNGCNDSNCESCKIKMDGSGGVGDLAKLTVFRTDDLAGEVEENFVFPYNIINNTVLDLYVRLRQINGYTIRRLPKQES